MREHSYNRHSYKTEAIILARRNFGEADRILTILTKHRGKLRVIAKGVRRPTSRKRGSLELFNQVVMFLAKGKTLDVVTEVELVDHFGGWRKDLTRVGVAYHLVEVINKLTQDKQEVRRVYEILVDAFSNLNTVDYFNLQSFIHNFKSNVLTSLGFLSKLKPQNDLDYYIEDLTQSKLKTRRFLHSLA